MSSMRIVRKPRLSSSTNAFEYNNFLQQKDNEKKNNSVTNQSQRKRPQTAIQTPQKILIHKGSKEGITNQKRNSLETDQIRIDKLSDKDTCVKQLQKELKLKQDDSRFKQIIEQNQDYLLHLTRNCVCFKCECCTCKCEYAAKIKYRSAFKTSYSNSFHRIKQDNSYDTPQLNQNHYQQRSQPQQHIIRPMSVSCNVYRPVPQRQVQKRPKPSVKITNNRLTGSTTYNNMYVDWKTQDAAYVFKQPKHQSTHKDMPILLDTNYRHDYIQNENQGNQIRPNSTSIKERQKHETFPNKIHPVRFNTTYSDDFQPLGDYLNKIVKKENEPYVPLQGIGMKTVNQQDFKQWNISKCIGQQMLKRRRLQTS